MSFLEGIINPSVENLELRIEPSANADITIAAFTKLFPNVKNFTYEVKNEYDHGLDQIHNWKSLESINCMISNINEFFNNINLLEKLTTCIIYFRNKDDFMKPQLMNFVTCCPNIKYLSLNTPQLKVPEEILFLIVKALKSLETLIWNKEICSLSNYSANLYNRISSFQTLRICPNKKTI